MRYLAVKFRSASSDCRQVKQKEAESIAVARLSRWRARTTGESIRVAFAVLVGNDSYDILWLWVMGYIACALTGWLIPVMVPVLCITIPILFIYLSLLHSTCVFHALWFVCSSNTYYLYLRPCSTLSCCTMILHMQYFTYPQTTLFCCEAVHEGRQMKCKGHVVSCDRNASTVVSIIFAYKSMLTSGS